jgi:hypothetical protein
MLRSIAEYLAASLPGAALLFAFFALAEIANWVIKGGLVVVAFLPVICIMPILSGVVSTLALEKIRGKPLTLQRGAMVGAAAGLSGSLLSAVLLLALALVNVIQPFGSGITGILLAAALLAIVLMDALLGALGGALVVKFIKEM